MQQEAAMKHYSLIRRLRAREMAEGRARTPAVALTS